MILTTTETVPGYRVAATYGIVRGNTVRSRSALRNLIAWFRLWFGGEVPEYTKIVAEAREQALDRMREQAVALGADAVVMVRFSTSEVISGAAEIIAYGTAVRLETPAPAPA
ncbi:MAG: YbjQ family protein [Planctomycetota bacterium]|nr:MAG: YbjQ family protein [Planctomycetota bacterium]